jgi:hypothetical protein
MNDTERIKTLEEIAREIKVEIHTTQSGVVVVTIGRVEVSGVDLRVAIDTAIGAIL